ncbi:unnamed protein product [Mycena citricolor]|uniref:Uncharacterized protein n=1 Tax=Mycena citricolor TaxID=2018698 RepID=A0AAD2K735_9AGAR|nr:unnamed protein product [Mycena citricolor]
MYGIVNWGISGCKMKGNQSKGAKWGLEGGVIPGGLGSSSEMLRYLLGERWHSRVLDRDRV